jgi:pSer/pThr/pTyr-binding forkhead associated (FHA) protein
MVGINVRVGMIGGAQKIEKVFQKHEISIGRSPFNDIILKRPSISKLHCRAIFVNGVLMVGDAGSTNGTHVNGKRVVAWTPVRASDEVWVGEYALIFSAIFEAKQASRDDASTGKRASSGKSHQKQKSNKKREQKKTKPASENGSKQSSIRTPWEILGVPKGTSKSEARKAYINLLKMYHPDKVDSLGPKLKELALAITRELNDAWSKIESGNA